VTEAISLFSTPPALVLLVLTAICVRFASKWGALVVVVLWTLLVSKITFSGSTDPTGVRAFAMKEGCIGSPSLFIAIVAVMSVALILYTSPRSDRI